MKKTILITLGSTALAAGAFAQGTVGWLATGSFGVAGNTLIQATDGTTAIAIPNGNPANVTINAVNYGSLTVDWWINANPNAALTIGSDGTPDFTGWTEIGVNLHQVKAGAGKQSTTLNLPASGTSGNFTPGNDVRMEVVGWTGTATSWTQALANITPTELLGFGGNKGLGALGWDQPTGNPNTTPAGLPGTVPTGANAWSGLVLQSVPEPTTMVLGGLGAAALLLFRRRK